MSRAGATKGGKDKPKPQPSTPVTATEIVPGKFNESDWNAMVERDNAEDFIQDIVDEVLGNTMDAIYKLYIEKQLMPFTITQAKDAILQIIEWQFLARDEGEEGITESNWLQDEEPDAAVTDCWAQGSVPKTHVPHPSPIPEEEEEKVAEEEIEREDEKVEPEEPEMEDKVSEGEEPEEADAQAAEAEAAAASEAKKKEEEKAKKKRKFKPYRGKLKSAGVSRMTESLEETEINMFMEEMAAAMSQHEVSGNLLTMPASCHSILRVQNGRPPGNKDVEYDEMGNVVAVMKLDTEKLPNHRVNVRYRVVDPAVEAAQARLESMRRGRYIAPTEKQLGKSVKSKKSCSDSTITGKTSLKSVKYRRPTNPSLPPSLLEAMDVSTGVVVTEAGRTKKGPGRYIRKSDILEKHQKDLQPVTIKINSNTISVSDLLDRNTPILRPIDDSRPLPPIIPTPPNSTPLST
ncbi:uncharacterized protein LOC143298889 [Babylonia areolata]|uniref:uncharacterized protein LOC143298889 n=1 Tax=Babylonia areolata TaxID=304850 RepID=UPI003FD3CE4C